MLIMKQPEVKKGIVPYKMAKKRAQGAYVLPDGSVVEDVTSQIEASIAQTFFSGDNHNIVELMKDCVDNDCDVDNREVIRNNLIVAGGTSCVPFFESQLTDQLSKENHLHRRV